MQVITLSAQLRFESELVDWNRDATSLLYCHLLIENLPRTDERLRYFESTGSFHSELFVPDRLKILKSLDDEYTSSLYLLSVPIIFQQMRKSFLSVLPKRVYQLSLQIFSKSV